ncbi:MAG TPA: hypothetical protein VFE02_06815 [Candidatus Acidoferrales bacterium]|nr:hypothetical protein [Candidatus Acidoferrales bacterium]
MPTANAPTLTLSTAPAGAVLTGNSLTWTPTAAQSRVSNQFSVVAKNAAGSATQTWIVTPAGTVNGTYILTYWTANGPVNVPIDWTKTLFAPIALVPRANGTFQTAPGTGNSDGTFSIPNIPGGYFWLRIGNSSYWTSSSFFDFGADTNTAAPGGVTNATTTTTLQFNLSGLDPLQDGDEVEFLWDSSHPLPLPLSGGSPAGATTISAAAMVSSNIDFSQSAPGYLLQYEPESLGTVSALRLGAEATLPALTFVNGASNTVTQALLHTPETSFDLNVKGSAWATLFSNAAPSPATVEETKWGVTAEAFMSAGKVYSTVGMDIPLLVELVPPPSGQLPVLNVSSVCPAPWISTLPGFNSIPVTPPILTDQDFGIAHYGEPFPAEWPRVFTFCQTATVQILLPGFATPAICRLIDGQSNSLPTSPISPLINQVQNPTINGMSIFTAASVAPVGVTLQWAAPVGQLPTGYKITASVPNTLPHNGGQEFLPAFTFYAAKTSASLPPLQAGQTYLFLITSILDGAANFETRPNRAALPSAAASVVSAPITTSTGP